MAELTKKEWEKVDNLVDSLHCSIADAIQIMNDDKAIDKGEKLFELSAELEAGAKKARQADRKTQTAKVARPKKANAEKAGLIELLTETIKRDTACNSMEITNAEREFVFTLNGTKYKITLACPRS